MLWEVYKRMFKPGDRVRIRIPPENVKFGCDKRHPQGGIGTVIEYYDPLNKQVYCIDPQGLVHIELDEEFIRSSEGKKEKVKRDGSFTLSWKRRFD